MNMTNMNANLDPMAVDDSRAAIHEGIVLPDDGDSGSLNTARSLLQSALTALSEGRISELVAQFNEPFKFTDHALTLEFTEKTRLTEFFQKARELFPDTAVEVISIMESGDHAIAEWRLTATQTVPFFASTKYQFRISLQGSTIIRVENDKIVKWSDYYDENSSRRVNLAAHFTGWIEF